MRHLSRARLFLIALLVASGWSCTETLVGVVDVSVVDIAPPSASVFVGESVTLQALTKDDRGNTLNGRPLTWMSEDPQIASVDAQGRVTGVSEGATNIIASSEGISRSARVTVLPRPAPARIAILSGDDQTAVAGSPVDSALAVRVTDASDAPVANVAVTFVVTSGGGSLASGAPVFTNGSGIALSPRWTLGAAAGLNTVRATAAGLPNDSVIFTATATQGAATRLAITTQPSASALNGSVFQRQPVVQVRDAGGNAVNQAGIAVTAAIESGAGTLNGTITVNTDNSGAARFTDLAITGPEGEKRLEFTAPGVTPVQSAVITITTGSGTKLTLLTQPSSSVQNAVVFPRQPVVQLQDAGGNAVAQAGVLVTASILSGGGTLSGTRAATTNAAGTATFTDLSMTGTVGDRTLQFTASGIAAATSNTVTLTVGPASAARSSASVPGGIAGSATTITITVRDAGQNPVTGEAARLAVAVTGANTASPAVTEIGGGNYRATYTPSTIGTDQIAIRLGGTPIAGSPYTSTITASGLSDANSSVIASPSQGVVADGADQATVTVTLADPFGNPVSGLSDADFAIVLTGSAVAGVVSEGGTPGRYTFTVTDTVAESVTVTVTAGGTQLSQQPTIGFVPGAIDPARSAVVASPTSGVAADGAAASIVTVTLADAHGNAISGLTAANFSLGITGSAQAGTISAGAVPGTYTFGVTNTVAQAVTVTVTANGVQLTQKPAIGFVTGGVSASRSTVTASPATGVTADGSAASTVTVTLLDPNGNAIAGLTSADFSVALTGSARAGAVAAAGSPGTYTFTVTDTVAQTVTVTVSASGIQLAQRPTIGFVSGGVSASRSSVVSSPTAGVTANGIAASTVTVTLADAYGNAVSGLTNAAFNVALTGSAQASTIAPAGAPGTYTFTVTNTVSEVVTVTVSAAGVQLTQRPTIGFSAGGVSASLSTVVASPAAGVPADGLTASTVTVTLKDANGNPVTGLTNAGFSISVTGSATAGAVTATGTPGVYSFTVTNTVAQTVTVTVTAGGVQLTQTPTIGFVTTGVSAPRSIVVANPATGVTANGTAASTVTVTLRDANDNTISGVSPASFTIAVTGSAQAGAVSAGAAPGTYTFTVTNTVAETVTVTVTASGVQISQKPTIGFVPGPISTSQSTVTASPSSGVTADGSDASTVTVTLKDATGNPISGVAGSAFAINVSGSGQAGAVSTGPTSGTYTFPVTNTTAETVTVTVSVSGVQLTPQPSITFVSGGVSAAQSSASASPTTGVTADGAAASTVTVTLEDASGNPISGAAISVGVSGSGQAGTVTAGASGSYSFPVTNTVAETVTVTVTANGVQLTQQPTIGFVAGPVSAASSNVSANPTSNVIANGVAASTVTVTLADANGNPVAGLTNANFLVNLTGSAQAGTVSATGTAGTYTFTVTDTLPETVTVSVTADGVPLTPQPTITFVPAGASPSLSTVVASPTSGVTADGVASSIVTVSVRDANNNRIAGLTASDFAISVSGSGAAGPLTVKSGPPGVFEFPVTNTVAEQVTVTVSVRGVQLATQPTIGFVPGAVSAAQSSASANPTSGVTADGTDASTVTVTVRDATGNPISGLASGAFNITVSGSGQAGAVTAGGSPGVYTFSVTNTAAEQVTVTITASGITLADVPTIDFVAGPVSASSTASANPTTVPADGSTASTVTVTLQDANGNAISGLAATDFAITHSSGTAVTGTISEPTPGSGIYEFTVTNSSQESVTITITVSGIALNDQPAITFN